MRSNLGLQKVTASPQRWVSPRPQSGTRPPILEYASLAAACVRHGSRPYPPILGDLLISAPARAAVEPTTMSLDTVRRRAVYTVGHPQ